ncbi:MAG: hypothetical protein ACPGUD_05890 [Parashewanella sp.]
MLHMTSSVSIWHNALSTPVTEELQKQLLTVIDEMNIASLELILATHPRLNIDRIFKKKPLLLQAINKFKKVDDHEQAKGFMTVLLDNISDFDASNEVNENALHYLLNSSAPIDDATKELTLLLIESGTSVLTLSSLGNMPLLMLCGRQWDAYPEVRKAAITQALTITTLEQLLVFDTKQQQDIPVLVYLSIHHQLLNITIDAFTQFLRQTTDANVTDANGHTALCHILKEIIRTDDTPDNKEELIKLEDIGFQLLAFGANPLHISDEGQLQLNLILSRECDKVPRLRFRALWSVECQADEAQMTPDVLSTLDMIRVEDTPLLIYMVQKPQHYSASTITLLCQFSCNKNIKDTANKMPMDYIQSQSWTDIEQHEIEQALRLPDIGKQRSNLLKGEPKDIPTLRPKPLTTEAAAQTRKEFAQSGYVFIDRNTIPNRIRRASSLTELSALAIKENHDNQLSRLLHNVEKRIQSPRSAFHSEMYALSLQASQKKEEQLQMAAELLAVPNKALKFFTGKSVRSTSQLSSPPQPVRRQSLHPLPPAIQHRKIQVKCVSNTSATTQSVCKKPDRELFKQKISRSLHQLAHYLQLHTLPCDEQSLLQHAAPIPHSFFPGLTAFNQDTPLFPIIYSPPVTKAVVVRDHPPRQREKYISDFAAAKKTAKWLKTSSNSSSFSASSPLGLPSISPAQLVHLQKLSQLRQESTASTPTSAEVTSSLTSQFSFTSEDPLLIEQRRISFLSSSMNKESLHFIPPVLSPKEMACLESSETEIKDKRKKIEQFQADLAQLNAKATTEAETQTIDQFTQQLSAFDLDSIVGTEVVVGAQTLELVNQLFCLRDSFNSLKSNDIEAIFSSTSSIMSSATGAVSSTLEVASHFVGEHSEALQIAVSVLKVFDKIQTAFVSLITLLKSIKDSGIAEWQAKDGAANIKSTTYYITAGVRFAKKLAMIAKKLACFAKEISTVAGVERSALSNVIPGLAIGISLMDIVVRLIFLANSIQSCAQTTEMKVKCKENFKQDPELCEYLDEHDNTLVIGLEDLAFSSKDDESVDPINVKEARRYLVIREGKLLSKKRIGRASVGIFVDVLNITAEIVKYTGVSAPAGISIAAASATTQLSAIGLRKSKQFVHDVKGDQKSEAAKHTRRLRHIEVILDMTDALIKSHPDKDLNDIYLAQVEELDVILKALGMPLSKFLKIEDPEKRIKKLYKAMQRRE